MIESFQHKGLRLLFEKGDRKLLNPQHVEKIEAILTVIHAAPTVEAINLPSFRLHKLTGDLDGYWSVTVRANWRIVFYFEEGNAFSLDLIDYH